MILHAVCLLYFALLCLACTQTNFSDYVSIKNQSINQFSLQLGQSYNSVHRHVKFRHDRLSAQPNRARLLHLGVVIGTCRSQKIVAPSVRVAVYHQLVLTPSSSANRQAILCLLIGKKNRSQKSLRAEKELTINRIRPAHSPLAGREDRKLRIQID